MPMFGTHYNTFAYGGLYKSYMPYGATYSGYYGSNYPGNR